MLRVHLERFAYSPMGTFGRLTVGEDFQCFSVEQPWRDNQPRISCIPEGTYPLVRSAFYRGENDTWEVAAVDGRSRILIHKANRAAELMGCIAPGRSLGVILGEWAVVQSAAAFTDLMDAIGRVAEAVMEIDHFCPKMRG